MESTIDKYLTVAQDNRITQTAHAKNEGQELTTYQKKLILLTIGHIKKDESEFKIEKIPFKKFMDVMGISHGGNTERIIAESVETLVDKSFFIKTDDEKTKECIWVNRDVTRVNWSQKVIEIQLHKSLKEYFLNLDGHFTSFQLGFVTKFSSKYTFRVYEYLHSYQNLGKTLIKREDALKILGNNHYHHIADFDRYVLKKAVEEINEYSDITVKYRRRITKKIITHFFFIIQKKDPDDIEIIQEEWCDHKTEYEKIANEFDEFIDSYLKEQESYSTDEIENNNVYKSEVL